MKRSRPFAAAIAAAAIAVWGNTAHAQQPAPFYAGRTVSMLIGFGPGGGNDQWARMIARHIGRHIPGNPNVVSQNVPGAGGLQLANQLFNVSPKDGTVFGNVSRGIPLEPLFGGQGTQFDPLKLNWIGSPDRDTAICVARKDAGFTTIKDAATKELVMGATGSGTDSAVYPEFLALLLGLKIKAVKGYKGSNEMQLAVERGEVQGLCGSTESIMGGAGAPRASRFNVLFQGRLEPDPRMKGVAYWGDIAGSDEQKEVLKLFLTRSALGRPFLAPPSVPTERVEILRSAFEATMKDAAFLAEAEKNGMSVEPMSGPELQATIERAYAASPAIVERTAEVLGRTGQK